jgi:beta-glucosidase
VPCGSALGATWDPELVRDVAVILGRETAAKRAHVLLAPTVNLHRNPLAGRNFECYSEDPHLTAELAVAYVEGLQSTGVASCIKHFVANDSEFDRHRISSEVSDRALRELYLVPFEAAVTRAGVAAVMSAYNRLNGTYCAEHEWLLQSVLKGEWSFDGAVISDWWGTMSPASAGGGLDLSADPNKPKVQQFVTLMPHGPVRYNSRLPLVVYAPAGTEIRWRLWRADGDLAPAEAR